MQLLRTGLLLPALFATVSLQAQTSDNPYDKEYTPSQGMQRVLYQGKYGYLDDKRKEVVPPKYKVAYDFSDGLARVSLDGKKYGVINRSGTVVIPLEYESLSYGFKDGYAPAKKDGKWGLLSNKGKTVVDHKYDHFDYVSEGLAAVAVRNGIQMQYGFIDIKGREVIPLKYQMVSRFKNGLAYVREDNKYGYINTKGKTVIPFVYESASSFNEGLAAVRLNGKWGFINQENEMVIPAQYDEVYNFKNGETEVRKGNMAWFIDKEGKELNKGRWLMIFTKGLALGEQFWYRKNGFDNKVLAQKYKEGFRYTDIAYNQHRKEVFLIMSKVNVYGQSGPKYNYAFDTMWKKIVEIYRERISVNTIAFDNNRWTFITSKLPSNLRESAVSNRSFPEESIANNWKDRKYITAMAFDGERWLVVFRDEKYTGQFYKFYEYGWDQEDVDRQFSNGYAVTQVAQVGKSFCVVFTKGTGIKEQQFIWSDELPLREIGQYWEKGYQSYRTFYVKRHTSIIGSDFDFGF